MLNKSNSNKQVILAGILLLLIISIGIVGYMKIDDYSFTDAVYMTVITVSTVGFGEVKELSDAGKLFTSGLILSSLIILGYAISMLSQKLINSQMSFYYTRNNNKRKSKKMENHIIVVGYGRNGKQVIDELLKLKAKVSVVDKDHNIIINNIIFH